MNGSGGNIIAAKKETPATPASPDTLRVVPPPAGQGRAGQGMVRRNLRRPRLAVPRRPARPALGKESDLAKRGLALLASLSAISLQLIVSTPPQQLDRAAEVVAQPRLEIQFRKRYEDSSQFVSYVRSSTPGIFFCMMYWSQ